MTRYYETMFDLLVDTDRFDEFLPNFDEWWERGEALEFLANYRLDQLYYLSTDEVEEWHPYYDEFCEACEAAGVRFREIARTAEWDSVLDEAQCHYFEDCGIKIDTYA